MYLGLFGNEVKINREVLLFIKKVINLQRKLPVHKKKVILKQILPSK